ATLLLAGSKFVLVFLIPPRHLTIEFRLRPEVACIELRSFKIVYSYPLDIHPLVPAIAGCDDVTFLDFIRREFVTVDEFARSLVHSLQTTLTQRFSRGVSFKAGYTIDNAFTRVWKDGCQTLAHHRRH